MIRGEMNKSSKQIVTEVGKSYNKTVVAEAESILINTIKETPVRGYEVFAQDITLTSNGYYRAYVGLRLPMGSLNVMYKYTVDEAVNAYNNNRNDGSTIDSIEWPSFDEDESNNIQ